MLILYSRAYTRYSCVNSLHICNYNRDGKRLDVCICPCSLGCVSDNDHGILDVGGVCDSRESRYVSPWGHRRTESARLTDTIRLLSISLHNERNSPPSTWFLPNFAVLIGVSLIPYFWWSTPINIYYQLGQEVYGYSVMTSAVHM